MLTKKSFVHKSIESKKRSIASWKKTPRWVNNGVLWSVGVEQWSVVAEWSSVLDSSSGVARMRVRIPAWPVAALQMCALQILPLLLLTN